MTTTNDIEIVIDPIEEIPNTNNSTSMVLDNIESDEIPTCRICLEPQLEDSNPILPLGCRCRHGLAKAHKKCLIKWFCQRRFLSMSSFDGLPGSKKCEICKRKLSPYIRRLLNDHWTRYFEREMIRFNNWQGGNERMATRATRQGAAHAARHQAALEYGMIWKDLEYFILFTIFILFAVSIIVFLGFVSAEILLN